MNEPNRGHDTESLRREFDRFDSDHSGRIELDEFCELLRVLGDDVPREVAQLNFSVIDVEGTGSVSFAEFCAWWLDEDDDD